MIETCAVFFKSQSTWPLGHCVSKRFEAWVFCYSLNKDFFKLLKNINGKSYKIANSVTFIARPIWGFLQFKAISFLKKYFFNKTSMI